jgi:hypothetical protein
MFALMNLSLKVIKIMSNDNSLAISFWTEFDNNFHYATPTEISDAYQTIFFDKFAGRADFDVIYNSWSDHRNMGDFPEAFRKAFEPVKGQIVFLANRQVDIIRKSFQDDTALLQRAFEDFGQGVLYNPNRPSDSIHKMDDLSGPPIGYHRWHAFIRAIVLLGVEDAGIWLHIDRCVGLAWAIQSEAQITQNSPNNPGLESTRLEQLRSLWMQLSFDDLDVAFDSYPFPKQIQ